MYLLLIVTASTTQQLIKEKFMTNSNKTEDTKSETAPFKIKPAPKFDWSKFDDEDESGMM